MKSAKSILAGCAAFAFSACAFAQSTTLTASNTDSLPSAPVPQMSPTQSGTVPSPQTPVSPVPSQGAAALTLKARSNLWPTATGDITGVDAESGRRITGGALNNPIIYERAAAGVMVTQLITDFGRTSNLISSANYSAKAENENALATHHHILLAVNRAFFNSLQAQAVLTVAQQTVNARQTVADQVGALFKSKLKSELDFSFASVNLAQAKLLLLDAQNNQ